MSLNRYAYVQGNPVNQVDPSGFNPSCQQQTLPCPNAADWMPRNPNPRPVDNGYVDENDIPLIGGILSNLNEFGFPSPLSEVVGGIATRAALGAGVIAAYAVGNDDGAINLNHFLAGGGDVTSYPVNRMLRELPRWRREIKLDWSDDIFITLLHPSVSNTATASPTGPRIPSNCLVAQAYSKWFEVGQSVQSNQYLDHPERRQYQNIYTSPGGKIDLSPFGGEFSNLISPSLTYGSNPSGDYTREEFDWFIALNSFYYWTSVSMVVDSSTGQGKICYEIFMEDDYHWDPSQAAADVIMAGIDMAGIGQNYSIKGNTGIICQDFSTSPNLQEIDFNLISTQMQAIFTES